MAKGVKKNKIKTASDEETFNDNNLSGSSFNINKDESNPPTLENFQATQDFRKELGQIIENLDKIKREQKAFKKNLDESTGNARKLEIKIEDKQIKSIESLGIFVALFTYISVSVQIFNRVSSIESATILMVLMFCTLASLLVLMDMLLVRAPIFWKDGRWILMLLLFLVGGISVSLTRAWPLNPLPATVEFENALAQKVRTEVISVVASSTYTRNEIDDFKSSHAKFIECVRKIGSVWPCVQ